MFYKKNINKHLFKKNTYIKQKHSIYCYSMTKTKLYVCSKTACDDNHNLYKLDLLWKERMTLPLWKLLPEDVFLKICKHVDSSFEAPNFDNLRYTKIDNISYEVKTFGDDRQPTSMTYEDMLEFRSIPLETNTQTLSPTEIIKPITEDLYTVFEQILHNKQEKMKDEFLPKPEKAMQYELMRKITSEDKYFQKIFG
jgi:hypothetical protein